jgi:hypothetical protein
MVTGGGTEHNNNHTYYLAEVGKFLLHQSYLRSSASCMSYSYIPQTPHTWCCPLVLSPPSSHLHIRHAIAIQIIVSICVKTLYQISNSSFEKRYTR